MQKSKIKNQNGQTLVELMIALGVILAGVLALFALVSSSLGLQRVVSDRYTASFLASEGIEIVKNFIDTNVLRASLGCSWNGGAGCVAISGGVYEADYASTALESAGGRPFFFNRTTGLYGYATTGDVEPTRFTRVIFLEPSADGESMRASSMVRWQSRGGEYEINAEDHFYNWR